MTEADSTGDAAAPSSIITPDHVKATLDRVRSGRVLDLSVPIAMATPRLPGQSPLSIPLPRTPPSRQPHPSGRSPVHDLGFAPFVFELVARRILGAHAPDKEIPTIGKCERHSPGNLRIMANNNQG